MSEKLPALMIYVNDLLGSQAVDEMDDQQFGWYMRMLFRAWHSDKPCYLPNNPERLWKICRAGSLDTWLQKCEPVMSCWKVSEDGQWIYNERLISEYGRAMESYERKREAGRKGGLSRAQAELKQDSSTAQAELKHSSTDAQATITRTITITKPTPQPPVGDVGVNFARGTLERMGVGTGQLVMRECGDAIDRKANGVPGVIQGLGDLQRAAEFIAEAWKARPPDDKRSVLTWLQNNGFEKHKPKATPPIGKPMGAK